MIKAWYKDRLLEEGKDFNFVENRGWKYKNGSTHPLEKYGVITIVGRTDLGKTKYIVRFEDNSYMVTNQCEISNKRVKNRNFPVKSGKGYIGYGKYTSNDKSLYIKWTNMLSRCYTSANNYGVYYSDVEVEDYLLNFQNFCTFILGKLESMGLSLSDLSSYNMDKDFKKSSNGKRMYSRETISLVPRKDNVQLARGTYGEIYIGVHKLEGVYEFDCMAQFANEHNISASGVCQVLHKRISQHKGWKFYYKEDYEKLRIFRR